jgi:hypothetical protein
MIHLQKTVQVLFKNQTSHSKHLMPVNKHFNAFCLQEKKKVFKLFLVLAICGIGQSVTQAQIKLTKVSDKKDVLKRQTAVQTVANKTIPAATISTRISDRNLKRINTSSAISLKKDFSVLLQGDYSIISLKLPGSSKESDYYVKKMGSKLILNGDIIVCDVALQSTMSYTINDESALGRKDDLYRWPGGNVPVVLDNSVFENDNYNIIKSALDFFNFHTGIVFKERTDEQDYLVILVDSTNAAGAGGYSAIGRQRNGNNILHLVKGQFNEGTVLHELMHTLGLFHEQARSDRDNFIDIHWDNIKDAAKEDFQIEDNGTARSAYDYCSIMQYSSSAFTTNWNTTITCKTNGTAAACPSCMGNRTTLSKMDLDGLDAFYGAIGISRFPCNVPFISSKVPVAGCIGVADQLIRAKWDYYKEALGDCQTGVISMGIFGATYVQFERGVIYHSSHGVFAVYGNIYQLYKSQNTGIPISDEEDINGTLNNVLLNWNKTGYTRVSKFEKYVIIWGPQKMATVLTNEKFLQGPFSFDQKIDEKVQPMPDIKHKRKA